MIPMDDCICSLCLAWDDDLQNDICECCRLDIYPLTDRSSDDTQRVHL